MAPDDQRPDPESLLDLVKRDPSVSKRGRLKIFFGASAGVGKTYTMLSEARRRLQDGINVEIGVVETHGREETAALIEGIPVIPARVIEHRGVQLSEFDLEVALERKPSLILMDELAHTNAPGSLHPKRWQDVEELLSRGIDVYTTLNVQHLESLNDMVAKLTSVQVRETVPDQIFEEADDIALIDIPSDELLKRLNEGKVYIAPGAHRRAAENFFKKTNLVALRELALRRTADRVDAQMNMLTAAQGQKEAQLSEKILVCVGHDALSTSVIRHAKRIANRAKASWTALYVETSRHQRLSDKAKLAVDRNLRLAERMGGSVIRLTGSNAVEEILNYARDNGFTRIVVGHRKRLKGIRMLRGALFVQLTELGGGLEITTVSEGSAAGGEKEEKSLQRLSFKPSKYFMAILILLGCTLLGLPFREISNPDNLISMFYLAGVVIIAARLGTGPSVMASILSVVAFHFFFTQPYYNFHLFESRYYFTFLVMLITSLIVGDIASKLSDQARQSRTRVQETAVLYNLTRALSSARGVTAMADIVIQHVGEAFSLSAMLMVAHDEDHVQMFPADSPAHELKEESVARWVLENGQMAGNRTDTLPSARGLYFPLLAEDKVLGVLGVLPQAEDYEFSASKVSQMETFSSVIASALQRAYNADQAEKSKLESEREKLRNVLLSSVSHDLLTPLASITSSVASALTSRHDLPQSIVALLTSIHVQASRLAKLVTNLLDVTSLESGSVTLNVRPYFIEEVIGAALRRVEAMSGERTITPNISPSLPLVEMDGLLIEQVLVNLIDNAIRFTKEQGIIALEAKKEDGELYVAVTDNGQGLPIGDEEKIFEKFYTHGRRSEGSAGLSLAICRGIIRAHGGQIHARNNLSGGATISFTLPIIGRPEKVKAEAEAKPDTKAK